MIRRLSNDPDWFKERRRLRPGRLRSAARQLPSNPAHRQCKTFVRIACLAGLLTLAACGTGETCSLVELGPHRFCVPKENLRLNGSSRGPGSGALIRFSRQEYAAAIPGYDIEKDVNGKPMDEDYVLIVAVPEAKRRQFRLKGVGLRNNEDLWFGRGPWKHRVLEPIEGTPWYRAYWFPNNRTTWQVLKAFPNEAVKAHLEPGFWLASCRLDSHGSRPCGSSYFVEPLNLALELDLDERNLHHRDAVAGIILAKLESWRR